MIHLIVGRTASGKDALAKLLKEKHGMQVVKSRTTRLKRSDTDTSHIFVDESTAKQEIPDSVAYTKINNNEYYTLKSDIDGKDVYVIDVIGIESLAKSIPDTALHIVYVSASDEDRHAHFIEREDDKEKAEEVWKSRNNAEAEQFDDFEEALQSDNPHGTLGLPMNVRRISIVPNNYDVSALEEAAIKINDYHKIHNKLVKLTKAAIENKVMTTDENGRAITYNAKTQEPISTSIDIITDIVQAKPNDLSKLIEWALMSTNLLDEKPEIYA